MEEYKRLADIIFPDITLTVEDYEKKYPNSIKIIEKGHNYGVIRPHR